MRLMCLGRISRPDIMVAINILARHVTRWSANDDVSLLGYIVATIEYARVMRINDSPAKLWLSLYADSDVGLSPDMKLTSGFITALQGPDLFPVFLWESKTQRAVSRSTTEAEFVALSTAALFGDAISLLAVSQRVIASTYVLKVYEDNQALLAIMAKGFSPKLKHLAKTLPVSVWSYVLDLLCIKSVSVTYRFLVYLRPLVTAFWFACDFILVYQLQLHLLPSFGIPISTPTAVIKFQYVASR